MSGLDSATARCSAASDRGSSARRARTGSHFVVRTAPVAAVARVVRGRYATRSPTASAASSITAAPVRTSLWVTASAYSSGRLGQQQRHRGRVQLGQGPVPQLRSELVEAVEDRQDPAGGHERRRHRRAVRPHLAETRVGPHDPLGEPPRQGRRGRVPGTKIDDHRNRVDPAAQPPPNEDESTATPYRRPSRSRTAERTVLPVHVSGAGGASYSGRAAAGGSGRRT